MFVVRATTSLRARTIPELFSEKARARDLLKSI